MSNYTGMSPENMMSAVPNRFFYGFRRTDAGELFLAKSDQMSGTDDVTINKAGETDDNFTDFEQGQDFYEGRDVYHNLVYKNLNYEQFRWDDRNIYYYVNAEGELVARLNKAYTYPTGTSSEG